MYFTNYTIFNMKIKVLQRNVWFRERAENLLQVMKKLNPDIICCQEITQGSWFNEKRDVAQFLAQELWYNYYFSRAHKYEYPYTPLWERNFWWNAIFTRFTINESFDFAIINSNDSPGHPYERRTCAVVRVQVWEKVITVATAHKSYSTGFSEDQDKIGETQKLINFFKENENIIFTWDLNLPPETKSIKMIEEELQNCWPDYSQPTWTTKPFSFMWFEENELNRRLDYVFASKNFKVISSGIISTNYSDHLPILVECEID